MADVKKRLSSNIEGPFYVDETCINCDTCRQLAPTSFSEEGDYSRVHAQPESPREWLEAYQALLACPVGCIGTMEKNSEALCKAKASFPMRLDEGVYYNGYNSEKSFGANSYFIQHPDGNWLVDSPRYVTQLVTAFEKMGGIRYIFLTHEDDVADADRFARKFEATRIIHEADSPAQPEAEWIIDGNEPVSAGSDFRIIPVPGHTLGSMVLSYKKKFLFTGDHMWWDREEAGLGIPQNLVTNRQKLHASTKLLLDVPFEWILPGHGDRHRLDGSHMHQELQRLVETL